MNIYRKIGDETNARQVQKECLLKKYKFNPQEIERDINRTKSGLPKLSKVREVAGLYELINDEENAKIWHEKAMDVYEKKNGLKRGNNLFYAFIRSSLDHDFFGSEPEKLLDYTDDCEKSGHEELSKNIK